MHFRTAEPKDVPGLIQLYREVARHGLFVRTEDEITVEYVQGFVSQSLDSGLIIVAEHPERPHELIGEIHAVNPGIAQRKHILTDLTFAVHPNAQRRGLGKSMLRIFIEEVMHHRQDIGKVELLVPESNTKAISLFQSFEFLIEGRMEMRVRNASKNYEADIAMGWQNPTFEFEME